MRENALHGQREKEEEQRSNSKLRRMLVTGDGN
jgi:hypothetical protein